MNKERKVDISGGEKVLFEEWRGEVLHRTGRFRRLRVACDT